MIKDLISLPNGHYVGDYRYDEGFRVREDNIVPCLHTPTGGGVSQMTLAIEVTDVKDDEKLRIRRLTPRECFRLQGWTDEDFNRAEFVNTDTRLYEQAGNGVTVNVIYEIARKFT